MLTLGSISLSRNLFLGAAYLIKKTKWTIPETCGREMPKGWGVAWRLPLSRYLFILPVPFNVIAGYVRHLWILAKRGPVNLSTNLRHQDLIHRQQELIEKLYAQNARLIDIINRTQVPREPEPTPPPRPEPVATQQSAQAPGFPEQMINEMFAQLGATQAQIAQQMRQRRGR